MNSWHLAWLSVVRRRLPTWITILSIAMAVACGGILLRLDRLSSGRFNSIGKGWDAVIGAKAGGIEILLGSLNGEGSYPGFIPGKLYDSLHAQETVHFEDGANAQTSFIQQIVPFLYFAKLEDFRVVATSDGFLVPLGGSAAFESGHRALSAGEVVVGARVAAALGLAPGANLTVRPWVGEHLGESDVKLQVVGVLRATSAQWDRMLFTTLAQGQQTLAAHRDWIADRSIWGENVMSYFLVNLKPGGFVGLEALVNRRTVGQVILVDEARRRLEELTGAGRDIGLFVSLFVLVLCTLAVASMLITRFEAMGVQLAVLRALGYRRAAVAQWLMWEGFFLAVSGCVIGACLDGVLFPVLRDLLGSTLPPPEVISSTIVDSWPVWLLAIFATVAAVVVPLVRLYRQDVHNALKA